MSLPFEAVSQDRNLAIVGVLENLTAITERSTKAIEGEWLEGRDEYNTQHDENNEVNTLLTKIVELIEGSNVHLEFIAKMFNKTESEGVYKLTEGMHDSLETITKISTEQFAYKKEQDDIADDPSSDSAEPRTKKQKKEFASTFHSDDENKGFAPDLSYKNIAAGGLVGALLGGINWGLIGTAIFGAMSTAISAVKASFLGRVIIPKILGFVSKIFIPITGLFSLIFGFVEGFLSTESDSLLEKIKVGFQNAIGQFIEIFSFGTLTKEEVAKWLNDFGGTIRFLDPIFEYIDGVIESFESIINDFNNNSFGEFISLQLEKIIASVKLSFANILKMGDTLFEGGFDVGAFIGEKISMVYNAIKDYLMSSFPNVIDFGIGLKGEVFEIGKFISEKVAAAYNSAIDWIKEKFAGLMDFGAPQDQSTMTDDEIAAAEDDQFDISKFIGEKVSEVWASAVAWIKKKFLNIASFGMISEEDSFDIMDFVVGKMSMLYNSAIDWVKAKLGGIGDILSDTVDKIDKKIKAVFDFDIGDFFASIRAELGNTAANLLSSMAKIIYETGDGIPIISSITGAAAGGLAEAADGIAKLMGANNYQKFDASTGKMENVVIERTPPPQAKTGKGIGEQSAEQATGGVNIVHLDQSDKKNVVINATSSGERAPSGSAAGMTKPTDAHSAFFGN
jgi:hypothetical protein